VPQGLPCTLNCHITRLHPSVQNWLPGRKSNYSSCSSCRLSIVAHIAQWNTQCLLFQIRLVCLVELYHRIMDFLILDINVTVYAPCTLTCWREPPSPTTPNAWLGLCVRISVDALSLSLLYNNYNNYANLLGTWVFYLKKLPKIDTRLGHQQQLNTNIELCTHSMSGSSHSL